MTAVAVAIGVVAFLSGIVVRGGDGKEDWTKMAVALEPSGIDTAKATPAELTKAVEALVERVAALDLGAREAAVALAQAEASRREAEKQLAQKATELQRAIGEVETLNARVALAADSLGRLEEARAAATKATKEVEDTRAKLSDTDFKLGLSERRAKDAERDLAKLKEEHAASAAALAEARRERESELQENTRLQKRIGFLEEEAETERRTVGGALPPIRIVNKVKNRDILVKDITALVRGPGGEKRVSVRQPPTPAIGATASTVAPPSPAQGHLMALEISYVIRRGAKDEGTPKTFTADTFTIKDGEVVVEISGS